MRKVKQTEWHIPISLIIHATQCKLIDELQLYMYLKCRSSGIVTYDNQLLAKCAEELQVTTKTIRTRINRLIAKGWLGQFKTTNKLLVRGFDRVCYKSNLFPKVAIVFHIDFLSSFKGFVGGAIFTHFCNPSKRRHNRRDAAYKDTALAPADRAAMGFPVAINGVAKCIEVTSSMISRLKLIAMHTGYIIKTANNQKLPFNAVSSPKFTKAIKDYKNHFVRNGVVYKKNPDLIATKLQKCNRRK